MRIGISAVFLVLVSSWSYAQTVKSNGEQHDPAGQQTTGAAAPSASPAQPDPAYQSPSVLKAVTRMVVVDVVATGKNGEPVTNLEQSDFTVLEDGKEQTIKVFTFQHPATPNGGGTPARAEKKLPPNIYTNIPAYKPDSALNVILLDALNTTMPNQAYVRDQMIRYLERMPDDRPVAVYALGTKLRLLQDFTSDHETLKEVIRNLKTSVSPLLDNPGGGTDQEILPAGLADSGLLPAQVLNSIMSFEQERTAAQTDLRVAYTIKAMNSLARQLAGYPGRKNLLWVSEAFPLNLDPNLELNNAFTGTRNYGAEIAAAAEALVDAEIAIYPVDARGLVSSSYFSAASTGRDRFGRSLGSGGRMATALSNESASLQSVHASMQDLAERTGGKAFYNRNDLDGAIRRSIDDGSTYYTLAYYPANKTWDGKFRKIQVKVERTGIKLRYRMGYYAVDPKSFTEKNEKREAAAFSDAMSIENPIATALAFHAGVVQPSAETKYKVYVNFGVDPHAVSFEEDKNGLHHAQMECAVAAFSEKGKYIKSVGDFTNAALKPETFSRVMKSIFPCQQVIELPPGRYLLRLGVRDLGSGLVGTTNANVTVPSAERDAAPAEGKH